ncbi:hypothetical protein DKX38_014325 [Salix brachista]|uniref:Alpha/beta hydrolase fold-3 domain-containing protein n=1 Tax=Salix brachista TaxID=2182728 RepID=A0A5N5LH25_9ROSI|nr:hypothetical protein DKX38_014325 [Salix brachista]
MLISGMFVLAIALLGKAASEIAILKSRESASDARLAAAHEQMRSAEEDAAEWKRKYDIAVRETKAALEKVAASSFEKDFQEMQEMLQQLKLEKEKTEVLLKEKDEMLKAKDDEIEMKGKEHEKMKSEFQKLESERLAQIERAQRHVESLYSDWDLLPLKTIKDPEAKKPEGWDDKEYIPDPEDKKPEDWDDEEDGEWTAPTISNPEYKCPWKPKKIKNPNYQGKWKAPIKTQSSNFLPTAYDDSLAGLQWIATHSDGKGPEPWINEHADLGRVILAGESAGANLAQYVAVQAGAAGLCGVAIKKLLIVHPFFGGREPDKFYQYMCPASSGTDDDPKLNPAMVPDLLKLKCDAVLVCVAEKDKFKGRGVAYYEAVKKCGWGGTVYCHESKGEDHCFHFFNPGSENIGPLMKKMVDIIQLD